MGERVLVATDAVIHHREASAHGRRADDIAPRPHRADREAAVHVLLAHATALAAPFVALRLLLGSLVRAGMYLLGKDVAAARDEVGAVLALALHPSKVRASRALVARTSTEPASVVRHLRPERRGPGPAGPRGAHRGPHDEWSAGRPSASVSALESGPVGDDADFLDDGSSGPHAPDPRCRPASSSAPCSSLVAVIGTRGLWLGDGVLQGGALLPPPPGGGDLWETYRQAWHDVGPGSTTPAPPYLAVIAAVAFVLLGKAPAAVTVLLLLGIPLAGWSAYIALRGLVPGKAIRVWAAAAYALLPAMTGAVAVRPHRHDHRWPSSCRSRSGRSCGSPGPAARCAARPARPSWSPSCCRCRRRLWLVLLVGAASPAPCTCGAARRTAAAAGARPARRGAARAARAAAAVVAAPPRRTPPCCCSSPG